MNTLNLFSTALLSTFFIVGCTGDGRLAYKGPGSCAPNANSVVLDSATYSISNSKSSKKDVYQFQQRITGTRESSLKRDQSNKNNHTSENKNTTNKFKTKDYKYIWIYQLKIFPI